MATATLVGDVRVEDEASVWYGAVLRADFGPIIVRAGANIQDGSVLHGGGDPACEVGEGATIGHLCVVHGAIIGAEALVGNGATVLDARRSRSKPDQGVVISLVEVLNQHGEVVMSLKPISLMRLRPRVRIQNW